MPEEATSNMYFGINEIMERAKKAYGKLFKKCLTWKRSDIRKSKKKTSK